MITQESLRKRYAHRIAALHASNPHATEIKVLVYSGEPYAEVWINQRATTVAL